MTSTGFHTPPLRVPRGPRGPVPSFPGQFPSVVAALPSADLVGAFVPDIVKVIGLVAALRRRGELADESSEMIVTFLTAIPGTIGIEEGEILDQAGTIWGEAVARCLPLGEDFARDEAAGHADPSG